MRTFLAIELPESVQEQVRQIQHQLQDYLRHAQPVDGIRWTPAEKIHVTLRFLGETNAAQQALIAQRLGAIAIQHAPFLLTLMNVGCFPHWHEPSIVWLAVYGEVTALQQLQVQMEQLAQQAGFPAESRAFAPHITIGRARRNADRVLLRHTGSALKHFQTEQAITTGGALMKGTPFVVEKITYLQSELSPAGAHYRSLAHGWLANPKL